MTAPGQRRPGGRGDGGRIGHTVNRVHSNNRGGRPHAGGGGFGKKAGGGGCVIIIVASLGAGAFIGEAVMAFVRGSWSW